MVLLRKIGYVDRNTNTIRSFNLPGSVTPLTKLSQFPWVIAGKQDYKKDFWFIGYESGLVNFYRGRVVLPASMDLQSALILPGPIPPTFYFGQLTVDKNSEDPTGGRVIVTFGDMGASSAGMFRAEITGDNPLSMSALSVVPIVLGPMIVTGIRGCALNKFHNKVTALILDSMSGNVAGWVYPANFTGASSYLPLMTNVPYANVGSMVRLETDTWAASPNYGWQYTCFVHAATGKIFVIGFNPDMVPPQPGYTVSGPFEPPADMANGWLQCAVQFGGKLWIMYRGDVGGPQIPYYFSLDPLGNGAVGNFQTFNPALNKFIQCFDTYKSGVAPNNDKWAGNNPVISPPDGIISRYNEPAAGVVLAPSFSNQHLIAMCTPREPYINNPV